MKGTKVEKVAYGGWPNCYRLTDGEIELIVTTDVGPRIIHCGFTGGQTFFYQLPEQMGKSGEDHWCMRGGHRLWIAPEIVPDSYALDNEPVKQTLYKNGITLLQPVERETQLQKEITVQVSEPGRVMVTHRVENAGAAPKEIAPWALSQMAPGGLALTAFPPRFGHDQVLQPSNPLVMWAYTDFSDKRYRFLSRHLAIQQTPENPFPQKVGLFNQHTICAYLLNDQLFVKRTHATNPLHYPDFGTSAQLFVNGDFCELETLGPLVKLEPGSSVAHVEHWSLHRSVSLPELTSDAIDHLLASSK
jgi:hypothetical protein